MQNLKTYVIDADIQMILQAYDKREAELQVKNYLKQFPLSSINNIVEIEECIDCEFEEVELK